MNAYVVENLSKRYRHAARPANDDISFALAQGAFLGLFGPNGAGKTTLIRQMAGLLRPSAGSIHLFGHDVVADPGAVPGYLGYFGQRLAALTNHRFREVLVVTGVLRGLSVDTARRQADGLIDELGIQALANRLLGTLSGGEQRLALLLATWIGTPAVLILDEPTNELDPVLRAKVWAHLGWMNREQGTTIVLVTHNLLEAERAIDQVAIVDRGRIQCMGTVGELKRRVSDRVRLEFRLRPEAGPQVNAQLAGLEASTCLWPGRWEIVIAKDRVGAVLDRVIDLVGLEVLEDLQLLTPTLEDVYFDVTGRRWQENESAPV